MVVTCKDKMEAFVKSILIEIQGSMELKKSLLKDAKWRSSIIGRLNIKERLKIGFIAPSSVNDYKVKDVVTVTKGAFKKISESDEGDFNNGSISYDEYVDRVFSLASESSRQTLVHMQLAAAIVQTEDVEFQLIPSCLVGAQYHEDIVISSAPRVYVMCVEVKRHIGHVTNALEHTHLTELMLYAKHLNFKKIMCVLTDATNWFGFLC